uniref:Uncharacterized protein n=1 Tax=Arundo donax TaxID=35708 RepID=A0A0A9EPP7_ARUDO
MSNAEPPHVHHLKHQLWGCSLLATQPLNGVDERHMEVWSPPEPGEFGPVVLPHRRRPLAAALGFAAAVHVMILVAPGIVVGAAVVA